MASVRAEVGGSSTVWPLLALLLSLFAPRAQARDQPTTVPIFLPAYNEPELWSVLRGSIVSSNDVETLYTIFCAPSTETTTSGEDYAGCVIAGGSSLPFTFVEGPSTLHLGYTIESSLSLTQTCALTGTTAATCFESASLAASFTGLAGAPAATNAPTSTSATLVLTGDAVRWGVLTLAEPPLTSTVDGTSVVTYYPPSSTSSSTATVQTTTTMATAATTTSAADAGSGSGAAQTGGSADPETGAAVSMRARGRGQSWFEMGLVLGTVLFVLLR
ncbi:hypothetical protein GGR52DRAFT_557336 [Hypoxylon sp. FL1284]|nr:hypothetical protein GGR52DRAFT_557336 [Hypoxylon sp. FL1284]